MGTRLQKSGAITTTWVTGDNIELAVTIMWVPNDKKAEPLQQHG
jgi:hypothetical protein